MSNNTDWEKVADVPARTVAPYECPPNLVCAKKDCTACWKQWAAEKVAEDAAKGEGHE